VIEYLVDPGEGVNTQVKETTTGQIRVDLDEKRSESGLRSSYQKVLTIRWESAKCVSGF